jgi:hypothetical protein
MRSSIWGCGILKEAEERDSPSAALPPGLGA